MAVPAACVRRAVGRRRRDHRRVGVDLELQVELDRRRAVGRRAVDSVGARSKGLDERAVRVGRALHRQLRGDRAAVPPVVALRAGGHGVRHDRAGRARRAGGDRARARSRAGRRRCASASAPGANEPGPRAGRERRERERERGEAGLPTRPQRRRDERGDDDGRKLELRKRQPVGVRARAGCTGRRTPGARRAANRGRCRHRRAPAPPEE